MRQSHTGLPITRLENFCLGGGLFPGIKYCVFKINPMLHLHILTIENFACCNQGIYV